MNNRFLRFIIMILQLLCIICSIGVSVYGVILADENRDFYTFLFSIIRLSALLLFTLSYYKNNVSISHSGNLFTIFFLLFATLVEMNVLYHFSSFMQWNIREPLLCVRLSMFSNFMMHFSILGFALFYQNNEHGASTRFMLLGLTGVLFLTFIIPHATSVFNIWNMRAAFLILTSLCAIAVIANLILMTSDSQKSWIIRQFATLLITIGSYLSAVSTQFIYSIVATALFFLGTIILTIIALRNSIIL